MILILAIAAVVAGVVALAVVLLRRYAKPASSHDDALRILNERFARGEIDKDEYEERRASIRS